MLNLSKLDKKSKAWLVLAGLYLLVRFCFTSQLDSIGLYSSYVFEVVLVSIGIAIYGHSTGSLLKFPTAGYYGALAAFFSGFIIFKLAGFFGILVPFDFKVTESLVLLLIVAPVLEELLFRCFLWKPVQMLTERPRATLIVTSLIFSYSHFHAFWYVEKELYSFVIFQTIYTVFLGLGCGYFMYRYKSITGAIAIHFGFNLGFYLASTPLALMPL